MYPQKLRFEFIKKKEVVEPINNEPINNEPINIVPPTAYEPVRRNKFILKFTNLPDNINIPEWTVKSIDIPNYVLTEDGLGLTDFWVEFNDPIGPSTSTNLWFMLLGLYPDSVGVTDAEHNLNEENHLNGIDLELDILDPIGYPISKWVFNRCTVVEADLGSFDYSQDSRNVCKVKFRPEGDVYKLY